MSRRLPVSTDTAGNPRRGVADAFCNYGLIGGLALGALAGVRFTGPHFRAWGLLDWLLAMAAWSGAAGTLGWLAVSIAHGAAGGCGAADGGGFGTFSGGGGAGDGGAGDGGCGGAGGAC